MCPSRLFQMSCLEYILSIEVYSRDRNLLLEVVAGFLPHLSIAELFANWSEQARSRRGCSKSVVYRYVNGDKSAHRTLAFSCASKKVLILDSLSRIYDCFFAAFRAFFLCLSALVLDKRSHRSLADMWLPSDFALRLGTSKPSRQRFKVVHKRLTVCLSSTRTTVLQL